jgi:predicted nucleotidyltransferase
MGIVLPPKREIIGLGTWENWVYKKDEWDVVLYSMKKFVSLLLKANPNVVGLLWLRDEDYAVTSDQLTVLRAYRDIFSSKKAYNSFTGYAYSQLQKLQKNEYNGYMGQKRKALVDQFGYDTKHASHCIRLLRMGIEFLETGQMNVWRPDAQELLDIKQGKWKLHQVQGEAQHLFQKARQAMAHSPLPDHPNYARAEELLMDLTMSHLRGA